MMKECKTDEIWAASPEEAGPSLRRRLYRDLVAVVGDPRDLRAAPPKEVHVGGATVLASRLGRLVTLSTSTSVDGTPVYDPYMEVEVGSSAARAAYYRDRYMESRVAGSSDYQGTQERLDRFLAAWLRTLKADLGKQGEQDHE